MTTQTDRRSKGPGEYRVLGTRPIRHDGLDKVTGRAQYGADIHMAGLLHGKILRSPHAHARIRSIDTSRAEALPGVKAVATAEDFPIIAEQAIDFADPQGNTRMVAENDLACDKVLYKGHAVAAVAASGPHIAEEALELIDVDYEVLPAVLNVRDAMKRDAPILHEGLTTRYRVERFERGEETGAKGNVAGHIQLKRGDLERGFKSKLTSSLSGSSPRKMVHQGYIEPFASTAFWAPGRPRDHLDQHPGGFRHPRHHGRHSGCSRVHGEGGSHGGGWRLRRQGYRLPGPCGRGSCRRRPGRPVKIVMSRQRGVRGYGANIWKLHKRCKIGADKTGKITAAQLYLAFEAGAYPGVSRGRRRLRRAGAHTSLDNLLVDGYDVVCNKPKTQAYRAPGHPAGHPGGGNCEWTSLRRKAGHGLHGELRLNNAAQEGDRAPSGVPHARFGCEGGRGGHEEPTPTTEPPLRAPTVGEAWR